MELLLAHWLPIVVSAAAAWIVSALCWMALPHHAKDFVRLPDEDGVVAALKSTGVRPGAYAFPFATREGCRDPEYRKRWMAGPSGWVTVVGTVRMGRNMLLTFLVYLAASVLIGYLATETLGDGASAGRVFQVTGTAGLLAYVFAPIPNAIWFSHSKASVVGGLIDGVLLGLATGGAFALLW